MSDLTTILSTANTIAEIASSEVGKVFLKNISIYIGADLKITENIGRARKREEWGYERESIVIDFYERPKLQLETLRKFENWQKRFQWSNFFATISKVWKHLKTDKEMTEEINYDNMRLLFDEAKVVTDEDMQEYIAELLAKEYNEPNSISRQTIRIVQSMTKMEFELFEKFAGLFWNNFLPAEYFSINNDMVFVKQGFVYDDLLNLSNLGLINMTNSANSFSTNNNAEEDEVDDYTIVRLENCGQVHLFKNSSDKVILNNLYKLTRSGSEILKFIEPKLNQEYIDWSINWFTDQGLEYIGKV